MEQLVVVGLRMEEEEEEDEVGAKTQEKESIWKGFSIQQRKGKHKERNPQYLCLFVKTFTQINDTSMS